MTTKTDGPGWVERLCYAAGGMVTRFTAGLISGFLLIYLTNVALLDVAVVSVIIGVSKFFDGISDIMVGNVIDNTRSRFGKARTWLLRMCLPLSLTLILLFWVPPQLPQFMKYVYVFLMYNIVNTVVLTFVQISHLSMISLLSDDPGEHSLLSSILAISRTIGGMLGAIVFVKLLGMFTDQPGNQNTQAAYTRSLILVCIVMIVLTLITVIGTRERVQGRAAERKSLFRDSAASLLSLLKSRCWAVLIICDLLINLVVQFIGTGASYYSLYILHDMSRLSLILTSNMIPTIAVVLFMPALIKRFGTKRLFIAGLAIAVVGFTGFGLTSPAIKCVVAFNAVIGAGLGLVKGVVIALVAETVVLTEKKAGQFIPGAGNAGISATDKLGSGLGSVLFGFALSAAGFNAAFDLQKIAQPPAVSTAISLMFIWVPAVMLIAALIIFTVFSDFKKEMTNEIGHKSAE